MKKIAIGIVFLFVFVAANCCLAESGIPNLVGTWIVKSEGGVISKGNTAGAKTHHTNEFSTLNAEVIIAKQKGRVLHGTFTSPKASESFIAVIGMDNKSFLYCDEDGFMEGKIVGKDKMNVVYRHVSSNDIVAGVGTWTRKK
jgi:hypothetical protein